MNDDDQPRLRGAGLKVTLPRLKIMAIFQTSEQRHLSAEDLYRQLMEQKQEISLATVYRVLGHLEQAGLLRRSSLGSGKAVYEFDDGQHHDHLVCVTCGRVEEFHDPVIEERQQRMAQSRGFKLHHHAMALYVACERPSCAHRPPPGKARSGA
ncbi:ferric iron uptake transcriptional regulator [Paracidovorax anthurii]|uniref:Ferric uptake regulation protein n=2 Tax=Paracidovorax anthurii TaxID=78229 RepID=A0A328ZGK3_9BURK|nr:ferric iron uptake transcriptional regulator [Paracidovorax anthurii]RAR85378.1 Fur family ferric uptake regulator [Paracidovorax anthurii]